MRLRNFSKGQIEAFKTEKEFRHQLVIPLIETLLQTSEIGKTEVYKVEEWHGNNEKGIDVYFGYIDIFGREKHFGVQTKIKPIVKKATAGVPNSILHIRYQIEEAYKRVFVNPLNFRGKARINGFYILTSKHISRYAREYFDELGFPNVELFDSSDLAALIRKCYR